MRRSIDRPREKWSERDGFPFPDHSHGENPAYGPAYGPARLNSFGVELAKLAEAEAQVTNSRTQNDLAQEGDGNVTPGTAESGELTVLDIVCWAISLTSSS